MADLTTNQKGRCQVLILSRNRNESVVISIDGIEIEVTLVAVKSPHAVRLGFVAPKDAVILRKELIGRPRTSPRPKEPKRTKPRSKPWGGGLQANPRR